MPLSYDDVTRHENFTARRLKSSKHTFIQVSLVLFSRKWNELKRKPPATCSTQAPTVLAFTEADHAERLSNSPENAAAKMEDF